jgi:hypothetical protein
MVSQPAEPSRKQGPSKGSPWQEENHICRSSEPLSARLQGPLLALPHASLLWAAITSPHSTSPTPPKNLPSRGQKVVYHPLGIPSALNT